MQSNEFALWFICSVIQWICKPMCGQTSKLPEEGVAGINWSTNFHLLASIARRALVPWGKKGQCPMFPLVNQETNIPKRTVTGSCLAWCPVCGNLCLCLNSAETRCMQGERAGMEVLQWFITMQMVRPGRETKLAASFVFSYLLDGERRGGESWG